MFVNPFYSISAESQAKRSHGDLNRTIFLYVEQFLGSTSREVSTIFCFFYLLRQLSKSKCFARGCPEKVKKTSRRSASEAKFEV